MAIAAKSPSQKASTYAAATSVARAYPNNVAAGSLLTIMAGVMTAGANDPPVAGDLTKTAGTATLGTIARDAISTGDVGSGYYVHAAIYSVIVSGAGSLTLTLAGGANGAACWLAVDEYTGTFDASRLVDSAVANGDDSAPSSGDADSPGAALFIGHASFTNAAVGAAATEDAAFSLIGEQNASSTQLGFSSIARIVTGATTDAASWATSNPTGWATALAVYREVAPKSRLPHRNPPSARPALRFF